MPLPPHCRYTTAALSSSSPLFSPPSCSLIHLLRSTFMHTSSSGEGEEPGYLKVQRQREVQRRKEAARVAREWEEAAVVRQRIVAKTFFLVLMARDEGVDTILRASLSAECLAMPVWLVKAVAGSAAVANVRAATFFKAQMYYQSAGDVNSAWTAGCLKGTSKSPWICDIPRASILLGDVTLTKGSKLAMSSKKRLAEIPDGPYVRSSNTVHCTKTSQLIQKLTNTLVPRKDFVGVSRWLSDLHGLREQARLASVNQRRKSQTAARPGEHKVRQLRGKTRKYEHDLDEDCGAPAGPVNPKRKRCSTGGARGAWERVRLSGCSGNGAGAASTRLARRQAWKPRTKGF